MQASEPADPGAGAPSTRLFTGPPSYVVRTPWKPLAGTLAFVAIFAGATLAAVIGAIEAWLVLGLPLPVPLERSFSVAITDTGVQLLVTLAQQAAMIGLTLWAASSYGGAPSQVLALGRPAQGPKVYALAFVVFLIGMIAMSQISNAFAPGANDADVAVFKKMFQGPWWPLALFVVSVGAPVSEEFLFRGFLFPALANSRIGTWGAAAITSLIFAGVHGYSVAGFAQVFAIGMLLCWLLIRTGSLRVTMFAHALNNSVQGVLMVTGADNWL